MATSGSYQHSRVFASLKDITEGLDFNLTTSQYLQALDDYIEGAIAPIIVSTKLFDAYIARLVGWQEKNFRRKVTFGERRRLPGLAIHFLLQGDPEKRLEAYRGMGLDRGIRMEFIRMFFDRLELYLKACNCELTAPGKSNVDLDVCMRVKLKVEAEMRSTQPLLVVYNESKYWYDQATAFKQLVLEKYVRMTLNEAKKDYVNIFNCNVDLDDVIQVYLLAASRAIDKCDARQGALTSHIKNWLLTGRSRVQESLDRQGVNISYEQINFESEEFRSSVLISNRESDEDDSDAHQSLRYLAKLADPTGAARAYLRIQETLTESEELQLKSLGVNKHEPNATNPTDRI